MFRNVARWAFAIGILLSLSFPSSSATESGKPPETVSAPRNGNGKSAKILIDWVPKYFYIRTKGLVPVHFHIEGLGDKVEFDWVSVSFILRGVRVYEEDVPISLNTEDNKNEKDREAGFGSKGNGTGKDYIAWLDNEKMFQAISALDPSLYPLGICNEKKLVPDDPNHPEIKTVVDDVHFEIWARPKGYSHMLHDGGPELERCMVWAYGDQTVNVVNLGYGRQTSKDEEWDLSAGSATKQEIRAKCASKAVVTNIDDTPVPYGTFGSGDLGRGSFDRDECYASVLCRYNQSNGHTAGSVKLTQFVLDDVQARLAPTLKARSEGGGTGTYSGTSYYLEELDLLGKRLAMNLKKSTGAGTMTFCKDATVKTRYEGGRNTSTNPIALASGVLWLCGTLAAPPTAVAQIVPFILNLGASGAACLASFEEKVDNHSASASMEGFYIRIPPGVNPNPPGTDSNSSGGTNSNLRLALDPISLPHTMLPEGTKTITCSKRVDHEVGDYHLTYMNFNIVCKLSPSTTPIVDQLFVSSFIEFVGSDSANYR